MPISWCRTPAAFSELRTQQGKRIKVRKNGFNKLEIKNQMRKNSAKPGIVHVNGSSTLLSDVEWSLLFKFTSLFIVPVLHSLRILLYIEAKCALKSVVNCTSPNHHFYARFSEKLKACRSVLRLTAGWSNITLVQMFLLLCTNRARA